MFYIVWVTTLFWIRRTKLNMNMNTFLLRCFVLELKMEAVGSFESPLQFCHNTRRYIRMASQEQYGCVVCVPDSSRTSSCSYAQWLNCVENLLAQ